MDLSQLYTEAYFAENYTADPLFEARPNLSVLLDSGNITALKQEVQALIKIHKKSVPVSNVLLDLIDVVSSRAFAEGREYTTRRARDLVAEYYRYSNISESVVDSVKNAGTAFIKTATPLVKKGVDFVKSSPQAQAALATVAATGASMAWNHVKRSQEKKLAVKRQQDAHARMYPFQGFLTAQINGVDRWVALGYGSTEGNALTSSSSTAKKVDTLMGKKVSSPEFLVDRPDIDIKNPKAMAEMEKGKAAYDDYMNTKQVIVLPRGSNPPGKVWTWDALQIASLPVHKT